MPKMSDRYMQSRRQQILDGARSCFARHGFEGSTVRLLETEIGLSSGAIFNFFPTKLDLFIAVAEQDSARAAELWLDGGIQAVVEAFAASEREMSGSYLELGRRIWSDPEFRAKWASRGEGLEGAIREGLLKGMREGRFRTDLPLETLAEFATIVLDGFMLRVRVGGLPASREALYSLFTRALSPIIVDPVAPAGATGSTNDHVSHAP
ncbi:TetR/AcrR family transcriptional regulator [Streptomyces sp. NPDC051218]|uniref:TetR/AcrR family transcriptional regulator n=1 Tax=Streptomyces sp. NPDC051218 TaxID=3365645 RepID=UPI00378F8A90